MRASPHTIRLVTMNGITVGDWEAVSQESGRFVGSGARSHSASALPDGPAECGGRATRGSSRRCRRPEAGSARRIAATREVRITGTA